MRIAYVVCLAVLLQVSHCMPTDNTTIPEETSAVTYLDESDAEPSNSSEVPTTMPETESPTTETTTADQETENVPYKLEEEGQGNATTTTSTTVEPPSPQSSTTSAPGRGALLLCPEFLVIAAPFFIRMSSTRLLGVV